MDRNLYSIFWELLKNIFGMALIIINGDWFSVLKVCFPPTLNNAVIGYFILSTIVAWNSG